MFQGGRDPLDPEPLTGQWDEAWERPRSLPSWRSLVSSKSAVSVEIVEEKGLSRKGLRKTGNKVKGSIKVNHSWRECGIKRRVLRWKKLQLICTLMRTQQNMPLQIMSLWLKDYFKLKGVRIDQDILCLLPFFQEGQEDS